MTPPPSPAVKWHFTIDRFLNPIVPRPPFSILPRPVSRFLGYREHPPLPLGNLIVVFWAFIGVFGGLSIIQVVGQHIPAFQERGAPLIIGSFGAAAVLEFYAIESPLAQPRNAVLGQLVSSLVGVAVCRLFQLSPHFEGLRWLAGALACACATAVMALTGTTHPPAGATALLAVADDSVLALGWFLVPVVLLGSALMLAAALLVNNIQRRFPIYWWTPDEVGQVWRRKDQNVLGVERKRSHGNSHSTSDTEAAAEHVEEQRILITPNEVVVPDNIYLRPEEELLLESLGQRLWRRGEHA